MNYSEGLAPQNFDELADWLLTVSSQFSPAELHGAIIGALSGTMRLGDEKWAQFGLAVMGAPIETMQQFGDLAASVLGSLAREQLAVLIDDDLAFQPFLPDDDETIEARTDALSHWCRGFLGGFAEAQAYLQKQPSQEQGAANAPSFSETVQEAISDLSAIAQAVVDDEGYPADDYEADMDIGDDPLAIESFLNEDGEAFEQETGDAQAAEKNFMEIIEYLRLATMTIFTEYGWIEIHHQEESSPAALSAQSEGPNGTLH